MIHSKAMTKLVPFILSCIALLAACTRPRTPIPPPVVEPPHPIETATTCGVERWTVKVGADLGARQLMPLVPTTIAELAALPRPSSLPEAARITGAEMTIYELRDVHLLAKKLEADSDVHLVIADDVGRTMIAELPDPACVPPTTPWQEAIAAARGIPIGSSNILSMRGLGFFDRAHGQTGAAPNYIELHPVIAICIGAACKLACFQGPGQ